MPKECESLKIRASAGVLVEPLVVVLRSTLALLLSIAEVAVRRIWAYTKDARGSQALILQMPSWFITYAIPFETNAPMDR